MINKDSSSQVPGVAASLSECQYTKDSGFDFDSLPYDDLQDVHVTPMTDDPVWSTETAEKIPPVKTLCVPALNIHRGFEQDLNLQPPTETARINPEYISNQKQYILPNPGMDNQPRDYLQASTNKSNVDSVPPPARFQNITVGLDQEQYYGPAENIVNQPPDCIYAYTQPENHVGNLENIPMNQPPSYLEPSVLQCSVQRPELQAPPVPAPRDGVNNQSNAVKKVPRKKRMRTVFSSCQLLALENLFKESRFLERKRRAEVAVSLGLTPRQIKIWFQNRRTKDKKLEEQKQLQSRPRQPHGELQPVQHRSLQQSHRRPQQQSHHLAERRSRQVSQHSQQLQQPQPQQQFGHHPLQLQQQTPHYVQNQLRHQQPQIGQNHMTEQPQQLLQQQIQQQQPPQIVRYHSLEQQSHSFKQQIIQKQPHYQQQQPQQLHRSLQQGQPQQLLLHSDEQQIYPINTSFPDPHQLPSCMFSNVSSWQLQDCYSSPSLTANAQPIYYGAMANDVSEFTNEQYNNVTL